MFRERERRRTNEGRWSWIILTLGFAFFILPLARHHSSWRGVLRKRFLASLLEVALKPTPTAAATNPRLLYSLPTATTATDNMVRQQRLWRAVARERNPGWPSTWQQKEASRLMHVYLAARHTVVFLDDAKDPLLYYMFCALARFAMKGETKRPLSLFRMWVQVPSYSARTYCTLCTQSIMVFYARQRLSVF